ncbi:hypothetical protein DFH08DRAFT_898527 [Mycena albidolilacea]|uniref:DUF7730 domain-containing protein n=1 Tax=Mycena albidolilacea TaxID=1033008 RepID=A0AAD7ECE0_9AGAR|nr:hypothetical protein DFH08DRAFT_898527 [Mycena albidolilacea]
MTSLARMVIADLYVCVGIVLCRIPCILGATVTGLLGARFWRCRTARPPPPPLPAARIDIRQRPLTAHHQSSYLFSLPLELRQCIYEHALGGHLVKLRLAASKGHKHYVIASMFYMPPEDPDKILNLRVHPPADEIPVALLRSCRQVYLEALPVLHRKNTFYFLAHEFHTVLLAALGEYCVHDIRNVYLRQDSVNKPGPTYASRWGAVFTLLKQMRGLECLSLELHAGVVVIDQTEPHPLGAVLGSAWGRGVLSIRGLRRFALFFSTGDPPMLPEFSFRLSERLRTLMTGERADERYAEFLAMSRAGRERRETAAVLEAAAVGH